MRKLGLMLSAILLLLSTGCAAQKNRSAIPEAKSKAQVNGQSSELTQTLEQLADELIAGSWLKDFLQKHGRSPFVLVLVTDERDAKAAENHEILQLISKLLVDSGKLSLILPKEHHPALFLPDNAESVSRLKQKSGADFLLQCKVTDDAEEEFKAELIDLDKAELIYSKTVINHKLKI